MCDAENIQIAKWKQNNDHKRHIFHHITAKHRVIFLFSKA